MGTFETDINIQTLIGLFFLVFCLVIGVFGFLLWRFRFLDGKSFYFSRGLGIGLIVGSSILAVAAVLMLIYVRVML
ncbi:MAG: hypothetical protein FWE08_05575 [Oscillospiraceae bacterium]|nr:hypothetical protein [Oscillospiraceae bacterium]